MFHSHPFGFHSEKKERLTAGPAKWFGEIRPFLNLELMLPLLKKL